MTGPGPAGTVGRVSDKVYKITVLAGSSTTGLEDAIENAVARAHATLRNLDWFEVTAIRGHLEDGTVAHYQVSLKVGFRLE